MNLKRITPIFLIILLISACTQQEQDSVAVPEEIKNVPATYQELQAFFLEWREFLRPDEVNGIPDYSDEAMAQQYDELSDWKNRLDAIDTAGWPVAHQVDWFLVWAEMNGLEFAHRVKKPWKRDPSFYVWFFSYPTDVPEREASNAWGAVEYDYYPKPLSAEDADKISHQLRKAPALWEQARKNLTGNARDLWVLSERSFRDQSADLEQFSALMQSEHPDLAAAALEVRDASEDFADWIASQSSQKTGQSGVGKANYSWNLKKVHLLPYTWEEELTLIERELSRAHSSLRLEENRNRNLPGWEKIDSPEAYDKAVKEAIDDMMSFFEKEEILTIVPNMDPALRERAGTFVESDGLRGFFDEVIYRDPMTMRAHHYHWLDLARMRDEPHPSIIRSTPLQFNIFDGRAEGMATGAEEMFMHAGLYEGRPRGRELVWVMLAQRAARALGALHQHGLLTDFDGATQIASKYTPWGLLPADGGTIQVEEHFYLTQPAYGTSYVIGKIEIEKLLAEYARQREGQYSLREFFDEFNSKGVIPVSLIYWEMTGDRSMLDKALTESKLEDLE
ncbi:DUF885 family protein [Fulvivirga sedimenti]|uniref:DUF885 domain-containing protein n=1 Tax=Fulvivirga sedimenti TaxID=2879465 RepID=A0A9X1KZW3_9BACT|nr:DUF885 family protein [Fulvivirga sedimenti]MCA6075445.1 DUF885 domain-containing protein [Fulvivirga sedimenti]MCA6076622.1 DUF885 domain-containing protein [Fulvivirga sedimenti]MCA6077750.1 DUF885 domain-containing protein [Fulvivirga sedimenti]